MKKLVGLMLVIVLVLSAIGVSYGAVGDDIAIPYFVSVNHYDTDFSITTSGEASYEYFVIPFSYEDMNKVVATVKIVNSYTGEVEYNQTKTIPFNAMRYQFMDSGTYDLDTRGTYELRIMLKCYKDNTLLEIINTTPDVASF